MFNNFRVLTDFENDSRFPSIPKALFEIKRAIMTSSFLTISCVSIQTCMYMNIKKNKNNPLIFQQWNLVRLSNSCFQRAVEYCIDIKISEKKSFSSSTGTSAATNFLKCIGKKIDLFRLQKKRLIGPDWGYSACNFRSAIINGSGGFEL